MSADNLRAWVPILIAVLAGSIATALVPQTVPILGSIAKAFDVSSARLGWIVSFPALACALGSLAMGAVVDRVGDIRLLYSGLVLVILGDAGASLAPALPWLITARLVQGLGYVSITVAAPTFIQRTTTGDSRRAAMALWAAHTPIGFAAAIFFAAQLLAAGLSWRLSFLGHAVAAGVVGLAALNLRRAPTAAKVNRAAGTLLVLRTGRTYAVASGALGAAMIQVGVMTLLPALLATSHGLSGPQSAWVIVAAMLANWIGAMLVVATRLRNIPAIALPVSAAAASFFGFAVVSGLVTDLVTMLADVMLFCATIGTANSLVWSLLPAAVPSAEAVGASAGLVTQGSFVGTLLGPPTYFAIRGQSSILAAELSALLTVLMTVALFAYSHARRAAGRADRRLAPDN
jgi:predicted MFS family arabinose efflux permease